MNDDTNDARLSRRQVLQFIAGTGALMAAGDSILSAQEVAADVDLGDGRPVGELFDGLALLLVRQDVHGVHRHAVLGEDGGGAV